MKVGPVLKVSRNRQSIMTIRAAFSLVEVVLAIGILGFCMIPIMALVPMAMTTSRQSMDRNLETRMVQTVRAHLQQHPYSTLPATTNFSFDGEGFERTGESADGPAHFEIRAENLPSTGLPGTQSSVRLGTSQLSLVNLVRGQTNTYSIHLPDNGY